MAKYYIKGKSKSSFGRVKELSSADLRILKKTLPSLRFVKVKIRR